MEIIKDYKGDCVGKFSLQMGAKFQWKKHRGFYVKWLKMKYVILIFWTAMSRGISVGEGGGG